MVFFSRNIFKIYCFYLGSTGDQINIFHKLEIAFFFLKEKRNFNSEEPLDKMTKIEFMLSIEKKKKKKKPAKWPVGLPGSYRNCMYGKWNDLDSGCSSYGKERFQ